ncbi:MAG: deaminase [Candidatus Saccharibacteria bacterium]|nr:deaminase [Candidatus Saccharibacteria bacterium]
MSKKVELFAGYIPVIHDGYIKAIDRHPDAEIGVFNGEILDKLPYLRKDIRALSPEDAKKAIDGLGRRSVIMGQSALNRALKSPIIMPDDDITRMIIEANPNADITTEPIFLRWDRDNSTEKLAIEPDRVVSMDENDPIVIALNDELSKSTNWWRHLGAVIVDRDSNIALQAHNSSVPTEYTSLIESDPRITAKRGESIERTIDMHAEAQIFAEASKHGIALEGCSICVSTFPCPTCAKLIAHSGMKACYYIEGYAMLDGQSILRDFGVEIIKIDTNLKPEDPRTLKPYPSN